MAISLASFIVLSGGTGLAQCTIIDQSVSVTDPTICTGSATTITTNSSEVGVDYYLRNDADNSIVAGPVAGTGGPLSFNTGTLSTTTSFNVYAEAGILGDGGLDFDGIDNCTSTGYVPFPLDNWTIEARFQYRTNIDQYQSIVEFSNMVGIRAENSSLVYGINNDVSMEIIPMVDGQWYHAALVLRAGVWEMYVDGVLQPTPQYPLSLWPSYNVDLVLGGRGTGESFNGVIDEVRAWTYPRTAAEINLMKDSCLTGNEPGLQVYYNMEEGTGNTLNDLSGNGYNATISSATWTSGTGITCAGCTEEMSTIATVSVGTPYSMSETVAVHEGESHTFPDGTTQTILADSLMHTSTLTSVVYGCDSIVQTTVLMIGTPPNGTCDNVLDFDGANDHTNQGTLLHPNNQFTVEFWANIDNSWQWKHIVENGGVEEGFNAAYRVEIGAEGELYCALGNGGWFQSSGTLNLGWQYNEWNHYAYTYDGDTARVFLNGIEVHKYHAGGVDITGGDGTVIFGSFQGGSRFYDGSLDEVRIWDAARTQQEIVGSMNTMLTGAEANLMGYWDFNDGFGSTAAQVPPGPNDGTLVSMDTISNWVSVDGVTDNLLNLQTICSNESVAVGTNTYNASGIYQDTLTTGLGCDSIVVTDLTVLPAYDETLSDITICSGDSALIFGSYETVAGVYTTTLTAVNGCDSVLQRTLNVNPLYNETEMATICDGDSYTFGTQTLTTAGTYTEVFSTVNGCDSTVVLTLNVNPTYNETATADICDGDSFTFGAQTLTAAGVYTEVFQTGTGCDSTVVLTLTVNPTYNETATATICSGESYVFGAQTLTTAGNYTEVFQSANGCDSTVVLTLSVTSVDALVTVNGNTLSANAANATYQWIDCDNGNTPIPGATNQEFTPTVDGTYAVIVTENGCSDTSDCQTVIFAGLNELSNTHVTVYPNPNDGKFWLKLDGSTSELTGIEVHNMAGQLVWFGRVSGKNEYEIDLGSIETGVYILTVRLNQAKLHKRIVVN